MMLFPTPFPALAPSARRLVLLLLTSLAFALVACGTEPDSQGPTTIIVLPDAGTDTSQGDASVTPDARTGDVGDFVDVGGDTEDIDPPVGECDARVGQPCGPCDLDAYECRDGVDLVCSGSTECGDLGVRTRPFTQLQPTSVTFHGRLISGDGVTGAGFCYGTTEEPEQGAAGVQCPTAGTPGAGGNFSAAVSGLAPQSIYYLRAFVLTSQGPVYGNEWTFQTPSTKPLMWIPDDKVHSLAFDDTHVYLGGEFEHIGPNTGGFIAVDPDQGILRPGNPRVGVALGQGAGSPSVSVVLPDGAGGW